MFGNGQKIVGVDIGFESIKLVGVQRSGKNVKVLGFNNLPLQSAIIDSDHIKDKQKIAELIQKGLNEAKPHGFSPRYCITVMPEFLVFSKTIQLPKMSEAELKVAALNQASQYIPVPLANVNVDSQILITHPDEPLVDILVVATPKSLVQEYIDLFKIIGLEILAIDTKALAATRAIVAPADKGGMLILEIGTVNSRLSIVDNRQVRFVSTIGVGGDQIIQKINGETQNREEFLTAKYKVGLAEDADPNIVIEKIAEDITKAIRYHQTRDYKASRISEIRICGSGSLIPHICPAIEKQVNIKTVVASFAPGDQPKGLDGRYAVALGLAMYRGEDD